MAAPPGVTVPTWPAEGLPVRLTPFWSLVKALAGATAGVEARDAGAASVAVDAPWAKARVATTESPAATIPAALNMAISGYVWTAASAHLAARQHRLIFVSANSVPLLHFGLGCTYLTGNSQ